MAETEDILRYRLEQAENSIKEIRAEHRSDIETLKADLQKMREAEEQREKRYLVTGISSLGGVVLALAGVLWAYRGVIFK